MTMSGSIPNSKLFYLFDKTTPKPQNPKPQPQTPKPQAPIPKPKFRWNVGVVSNTFFSKFLIECKIFSKGYEGTTKISLKI